MKTLIPLTVIAALAASGISSAQTPAYSKPSGYETISLPTGFNFVGIRLAPSIVKSGTFTARTSTTLTDGGLGATFSDLSTSQSYILELGGAGALAGMIMELPGTSFSNNQITGLSGLSDDYLTSYKIRPSQTIGGVFGTGANVTLKKGSFATADAIFIPKADGNGFDTYYHTLDVVISPTLTIPGVWQKVGGTGNQAATPINYLDGFYVQVRGSATSLVVTGQVKTTNTLLPAPQGFSYFSSIYPAGTTLATSNLSAVVTKGSFATADLIFMPKAAGGFDTFYHTQDVVISPTLTIPGLWQQVGGSGNKNDTPITSGFILQRRGEATNLSFSAPSFYSNL